MASAIHMPRLGWGMEEGTFGAWLKQDGEPVQAGDLIFTVEGDKATQEIEAFDSGILRIPPDGPQPGDTIAVGALLGYVVRAGEPAPFESQPAPAQAAAAAPAQSAGVTSQSSANSAPPKIAPNGGGPWGASTSKIAISPRARRVASELGVDVSELNGSGATGRIIERDIRAAAALRPAAIKVRATPIAQRLAQENGVDLAELAKQKAGDKIERSDVEAVIAARTARPQPSAQAQREEVTGEAVPVTRIRRLIAQRMAESAQTTAAVTLTSEADASELVALRESMKAAFAPRNLPVPSYNDLLIKLVAVALQAHPALNATWQEEQILLHQAIHVGLAVDTNGGLLVPVVRDVGQKSVRQIAAETSGLIDKAQNHRLSADDLQGGTFTITNLGMYGIDAFTPIINLPQCAILGVGRIVKKPAVVGDQVVPRQMVALSLTFDHRVVDGAPAARFLNMVREFVEIPSLWLVG